MAHRNMERERESERTIERNIETYKLIGVCITLTTIYWLWSIAFRWHDSIHRCFPPQHAPSLKYIDSTTLHNFIFVNNFALFFIQHNLSHAHFGWWANKRVSVFGSLSIILDSLSFLSTICWLHFESVCIHPEKPNICTNKFHFVRRRWNSPKNMYCCYCFFFFFILVGAYV